MSESKLIHMPHTLVAMTTACGIYAKELLIELPQVTQQDPVDGGSNPDFVTNISCKACLRLLKDLVRDGKHRIVGTDSPKEIGDAVHESIAARAGDGPVFPTDDELLYATALQLEPRLIDRPAATCPAGCPYASHPLPGLFKLGPVELSSDSDDERLEDVARYFARRRNPWTNWGKPEYQSLIDVLYDAYKHMTEGKGKDRHANDGPIETQPTQVISDLLDTNDGMLFQASKKIVESKRLTTPEHQEAELLGAINYLAHAVIRIRRLKKESK